MAWLKCPTSVSSPQRAGSWGLKYSIISMNGVNVNAISTVSVCSYHYQ